MTNEITVMPVDQLAASWRASWSSLQRTSPLLRNPFFSPEYAAQVAGVRPDVEVAIVCRDGECVGALPFERGTRGVGRPVGWRVSAIHGIIAAPQLDWDPLQFLREAGLNSWDYECVPAEQHGLRPFHLCKRRFPYVTLEDGYDTYRRERRQGGSGFFAQVDRKARKMEREIGALEFNLHAADDEAYDALRRWKSAQYRRTRTLDVLAIDWVAELLDRIRRAEAPSFSGVLSVLRAGGRIAAVHLGIRSDDVLAWWFPTYDPDLAAYSPGHILIDRVLRAAPAIGIRRLDLGQGGERYKTRLRSGTFDVAEGAADRRRGRRWCRRAWIHTRDWAGRTPLARTPLSIFRTVRNRMIRE